MDEVHEILEDCPELAASGLKIQKHGSDDLMNLLEITLTGNESRAAGIQILNRACYVPSLIDHVPLVRRSVEVRQQILEDLFGWQLLSVDEDALQNHENKRAYLRDLLGLDEEKDRNEAVEGEEREEPPKASPTRKHTRGSSNRKTE